MAVGDATENNGAALVGTAVSFLVLTYISVALRTYVRAVLTKSFQADDWLMLIAQVIFTLSCAFILAGVWEGIGRHNKTLPQRQEINALMWQALATATYVLNMMFIKLSIAVFLLRLAIQKRYKYTLWVSMVIVTIWSSVIFFWDIFQCSPVQAQWDYTIPNLQCVSSEAVVSAAYSISVMTILSDWLYALLPVPMVWNVKMSKQAKATVVVILGLGVFASVATLIRLKFLSDLNELDDILFAGTDAMVWTLVEPGVAIVASSLVTIRPLLKQMRVPGFESTENSKRTGPSGGRSGALRSGTQKSNGTGMPGFGPGDLTMIDIETGEADPRTGKRYDSSEQSTVTVERFPSHHLSRISEGRDSQLVLQGGLSPKMVSRSSTKSEVFMIEGPMQGERSWAAEPSIHSVDQEGLEPHSPGKVGLGT